MLQWRSTSNKISNIYIKFNLQMAKTLPIRSNADLIKKMLSTTKCNLSQWYIPAQLQRNNQLVQEILSWQETAMLTETLYYCPYIISTNLQIWSFVCCFSFKYNPQQCSFKSQPHFTALAKWHGGIKISFKTLIRQVKLQMLLSYRVKWTGLNFRKIIELGISQSVLMSDS